MRHGEEDPSSCTDLSPMRGSPLSSASRGSHSAKYPRAKERQPSAKLTAPEIEGIGYDNRPMCNHCCAII